MSDVIRKINQSNPIRNGSAIVRADNFGNLSRLNGLTNIDVNRVENWLTNKFNDYNYYTINYIQELLSYNPSLMTLGGLALYQDTNGSIVSNNAELTARWNDQTSNAAHLIQSTSNNRPTRSGFGVKFASGKSFTLPASAFSNATTIIAVFEAAAISDYHVICGGDSGLGLLVDASRSVATYIMGSSPITASVDKIYGTQMVSVVLHASADKIYLGDTECTYLPRGGSISQSREVATVGNNPANQFPMLNNVLHALLIFPTALLDNQISEIHTLIQDYFSNQSRLNPRLVLDGNSLMAEDLDSLSQIAVEADRLPYKLLAQLSNVDAVNTALGGQSIGSAMSTIHPYYSIFRPVNVCTVWEITNNIADANISAATAYSNVVTQCNNLRRYGWKVVVGTCLPRHEEATFFTEEKRLAINLLIRGNWPNFADALADVGANEQIGAFGANTGPYYFINGVSDGVHLGPTGNDVAATIFKNALNSIGIT